jgi:hypothetical protein
MVAEMLGATCRKPGKRLNPQRCILIKFIHEPVTMIRAPDLCGDHPDVIRLDDDLRPCLPPEFRGNETSVELPACNSGRGS